VILRDKHGNFAPESQELAKSVRRVLGLGWIPDSNFLYLVETIQGGMLHAWDAALKAIRLRSKPRGFWSPRFETVRPSDEPSKDAEVR